MSVSDGTIDNDQLGSSAIILLVHSCVLSALPDSDDVTGQSVLC